MPSSNSAWGIEIGGFALKAVRLERQGDSVNMTEHVFIPHKKVLSTPDLDADEMTRLSIGQFMSQLPNLADASVVVSVPGNAAFARFAKLPPVEAKKVPDIVKFEAVQQIPFPIEEVEWDYETFMTEGMPEVEVGIFAITKQAVQAKLTLYSELGLNPDGINLSPVAAYNALRFDQGLGDAKAGVVILDIGTTSSDVIIAEEGRLWIRTFPLGGHNFTDALITAFKLTYSKAEKLKFEAQTHNYRRQILSAMRPGFADLAQEVQRSIQYYQSLHRDANLTKLIGVGSTFMLPGLRKYLSQQLQMEVARIDEYQKIKPTEGASSEFTEHATNFATAYGLALQGLGLAKLDVNLVPVSMVRDRLWKEKIKWFGAAAAVLVAGSAITLVRPMMDGKYKSADASRVGEVDNVIRVANDYKTQFEQITQETAITAKAQNLAQLLTNRDIWPQIIDDVNSIIASANPNPILLTGTPEEIAELAKTSPEDMRLLQMISLTPTYLAPGSPQNPSEKPRVRLQLVVETPNPLGSTFINQSAIQWLNTNAVRDGVPYRILSDSRDEEPKLVSITESRTAPAVTDRKQGGGGGGGGGRNPSPRGNPEFGEGGGEGMVIGGPGGEGPGKGFDRGGRGGGEANANVEQLAPLPPKAEMLPPDTPYFRATITWQIEVGQSNSGKSSDDSNADDAGADDARGGRKGGDD